MNSYSSKHTDNKSHSFQNSKAMKKIEKKSIKFAMKTHNLSYHEKPSRIKEKVLADKISEHVTGKPKKRSASPMTKNVKTTNNKTWGTDIMLGLTKANKSRSGSRKTNVRSPGHLKMY